MVRTLRQTLVKSNYGIWLIVTVVLGLALLLGKWASIGLLALLAAGMLGILLLARPAFGLPALIVAALALPLEVVTGTEVALNPASLLVPVLMGLWVLSMVLRQRVALEPSLANIPLLLFVVTGLFSLLVGIVLWEPAVPRGSSFLLVQVAQWAIFGFSAGAMLLTSNLVKTEAELRRLTLFFLLLGGTLAIMTQIPGIAALTDPITTIAFTRAPFWVLLGGLAGGQLLFNREMTILWRLFLWAVVGTTIFYAFVAQQEGASNWVGLTVTVAILGWLRWPRLRWVTVGVLATLLGMGLLFPTVYSFAGGDEEWFTSGGSRLALITRVMEDTLAHNPVTGLGPAAYRAYGATRPLQYEHIVWLLPRISAHNNYVDIFGHFGVVGLALFGWLALAITWVGFRLSKGTLSGFASGYVNGMLAVWAGCLALMLLADWILPFVYNIGFPGFQASLLVWLFLGGLPALAAMVREGGLPAQASES